MTREVFSRDSQGDMSQPYTRSRYYHLYLNGMYWGLFQTQERAEARFAAEYLGGNDEDYDVVKVNTEDWNYRIEATRADSIGRMMAFHGNVGIMVRAYAYIRSMGAAGLKHASEMAVLNANYVRARLEGVYDLPFTSRSLHEVIFSDKDLEGDCHTLDVAKRLIDYGYHPPTIYFPLVVKGAIMIEPTETESQEILDEFCDAMIAIAGEARDNPDLLHKAPVRSRVRRLDETTAARKPKLKWEKGA